VVQRTVKGGEGGAGEGGGLGSRTRRAAPALIRTRAWAAQCREHIYLTSEEEPVFDAADIMKFGRDIFVHMGSTTNEFGFDWLRRHCRARGIRAHKLHFPDDMCPFHCDATFVPLRPYLAMENPARPMEPYERKIFAKNDWTLIKAAQPNTLEMPPLSQCSPWLCMNILSLSDKVVFCEETEKGMIELFNDQGLDVITLPFRKVFEFGGSFHCVTADVRRQGEMKSYFAALDAQDAATM
jgi:glycine amidinotransferase